MIWNISYVSKRRMGIAGTVFWNRVLVLPNTDWYCFGIASEQNNQRNSGNKNPRIHWFEGFLFYISTWKNDPIIPVCLYWVVQRSTRQYRTSRTRWTAVARHRPPRGYAFTTFATATWACLSIWASPCSTSPSAWAMRPSATHTATRIFSPPSVRWSRAYTFAEPQRYTVTSHE